jgi:hypothetical protein
MERLCADCTGDFRDFVRRILKDHLETPAPPWLEKSCLVHTRKKYG